MAHNLYKHPGIKARTKGQRYDKPLLGGLIEQMDSVGGQYFGVPAGSAVVELGTFTGYDDYGDRCTYQALEVTLPNGTVVPCYRRTGGNYMICQDYSYKAVIAK